MSDVTLRPIGEGTRFEAVDVLRGVAVLGILAMNIQSFSMPEAAYMNPTIYPEFNALNRTVYAVVHFLFDMKMMALFSMLFGAGVWFYSRKADSDEGIRRVRGLWFRRMGWLLLIGLIHAYFVWWGDILVSYAVCGLLALWWLRRLHPWLLIGIGSVLILFGMLLQLPGAFFLMLYANAVERGAPAEEIAQLKAGAAMMLEWTDPSAESIQKTIDTHRSGYLTVLETRAQSSLFMQVFFIPFYMFWRGTGTMLIGLALARMGVLTGQRSTRFYVLLALIAYAVGGAAVGGGLLFNLGNDFKLGAYSLIGIRFNELGSLPMAIGHVGLVMLLVRLGALGILGHCLAAAGRMALTNYLMQSIICTLIFYGYGLGFFGRADRLEQQFVVCGVWAFQLAISPLWLRACRFGPAEWLWRSLTYWQLQPMRHRAAPAESLGVPGR